MDRRGRRPGVAPCSVRAWANASPCVVNPTSGKDRGARSASRSPQRLRAAGHEVRRRSPTTTAAAARDRALGRHRRRASTRSPSPAATAWSTSASTCAPAPSTPLGIIAAGTGNDVARASACPCTTPIAAARRRRAPARARRSTPAGTSTTAGEARWFVGVLAAGFDALVNERANPWPWPNGPDALQPRHRPRAAACSTPSRTPSSSTARGTRPGRCSSRSATARPTAAGMRISPDAVLDDGLLDVLVLHEICDPGVPAGLPQGVHGHPRQPPGGARSCAAARCAWRRPASSPTPTASASARCR